MNCKTINLKTIRESTPFLREQTLQFLKAALRLLDRIVVTVHHGSPGKKCDQPACSPYRGMIDGPKINIDVKREVE